MRISRVLLAVPGLLLSGQWADAFGWRSSHTVSYYPVFYTYPVVYSYPACPVPVIAAPVMTAPTTPYAVPRAAPPSPRESAEPPTSSSKKQAPTINEMRSNSGTAHPLTPTPLPQGERGRGEGASKYPSVDDRCRVGFWNVSGRDVTIKVNGESRRLPRNRAVTLELPRDFVWQLEDREVRREQVPSGQPTFEIILRQSL
jgi:hypothetical protein